MSFLQIEHASPLTCDRYDTPEVTPGLFTRLFPSLRFYRHMLKVVWVSGNQAKKHYSGDDWVTSSLGMLDALEYAGVRVHVEGVENFIKLESLWSRKAWSIILTLVGCYAPATRWWSGVKIRAKIWLWS